MTSGLFCSADHHPHSQQPEEPVSEWEKAVDHTKVDVWQNECSKYWNQAAAAAIEKGFDGDFLFFIVPSLLLRDVGGKADCELHIYKHSAVYVTLGLGVN